MFEHSTEEGAECGEARPAAVRAMPLQRCILSPGLGFVLLQLVSADGRGSPLSVPAVINSVCDWRCAQRRNLSQKRLTQLIFSFSDVFSVPSAPVHRRGEKEILRLSVC